MGKRDYNPALNLPCFYFRLSSQRVYCAHCLLTLFFAMPQIIVFDTDGVEQRHDYQVGDTLMEVLREADYDEIQALCGGSCSCATCHVHVTPQAWMPTPEEDETLLLELADNFDEGKSRLSCQIELLEESDGLQVSLVSTD